MIPNLITSSRIILLVLFILFDYFGFPIVSLTCLVLAMLSDFFDGYVARKFGKVSNFGTFYDQFMDKLFVTIALVYFVSKGFSFILAGLIILREFIMIIVREKYKKAQNISSLFSGKLKMAFQMVLLISLSLANFWFIFLDISFYLGIFVVVLGYYSLFRRWFSLFTRN